LIRSAVEVDLSATTTTHLDYDSPSNQWFRIHRRSAPIAKPPTLFICRGCRRPPRRISIFFQPNVVYQPETMNFILKPLPHNDELFNLHRKVLKETMSEVITSNNDEALGSSDLLQTLGVESVAKQEISRVFDRFPLTRCNEHKFNQTMSHWRALQMKRL
jgi:hypothetical protein